MNKPRYNHSRIRSIDSLCKYLGVTETELTQVASQTNKYIKANKPQVKSNGKIRQTYRILPPLERIQKKIVRKIFHHVSYPLYIQGGIRDKESPRDYISDARKHTGKRVVIGEDVSNFFPSISETEIYSLWLNFFKFSPDVCAALTKLTTKERWLYQGSSTSSYIANLVFWDIEPKIVRKLNKLEIEYTRYIDDVTISSDKLIEKDGRTTLIATLYAMFSSKGLKANRTKHYSTNNSKHMSVHGITVNSDGATLNRNERERIRAAVHQCCQAQDEYKKSPEFESVYNQTLGRVQTLRRLHKVEGEKLLSCLSKVKPL